MEDKSYEGRILLALNAFRKGQYPSIPKVAAAFDVNTKTLRRRLKGVSARTDTIANCRKLSATEESTLLAWILDMCQHGLPPRVATVQHLAELLLSARLSSTASASASPSEKWVNRFVKRHPELQSKYTQKYDYQRAKREDPELIQNWFKHFTNIRQRYGILNEDIYNMDEAGFQMGVISTAKVICGSETRESKAKELQPGNREWATSIICVNSTGWALPPQIILAGKKHQPQWYSSIPQGYRVSLSENGQITNELCYEWLQELFE